VNVSDVVKECTILAVGPEPSAVMVPPVVIGATLDDGATLITKPIG
jgi:hypothetical protein